jgi:opacity protein-like surface antigen
MMHPSRLLLIIALAFGGAIVRAETALFVAPVAGHLAFGQSHYSGQSSYGFAIGTLLGADQSYEFSVEWTTAKLAYTQIPPADIIGASSTQVRGHIRPLLLGYRYRFGWADSRFRFFVGPTVGFTRATGHGSYDAPVSFGPYTADFSRWSASFGGSGGVEIELWKGGSLQLGYRYLRIAAPADFDGVQLEGGRHQSVDLGAADTHFAFAAVRLSF